MAGKTITQVAAGYDHSIVLASDGTVYTWGYNFYGQLGNGNTGTDSNVPVAVSTSGTPMAGKTITQVAAGYDHSIALASDGTVYTWGYNDYGQLGNGNPGTDSNVPVAVSTSGTPMAGKTITQVAAGGGHSIALASDGTVYTWGLNVAGQLGNGNTGTDSNVPVAVSTGEELSGKTITQVAAGIAHSIALASDGTVYTWGYNDYGQLGNGNPGTNSNVPVAVSTIGVLSGKTITQVAAGGYYSIALASDGTVYTWGDNYYGQLGTRNNINYYVPVAVDQSEMGPLPVELTSFSANFLTDSVELNWQTATEVNNYGFEVQRQYQVSSSEYQDKSWEKIGFVLGHGTTNSPKQYSFTDSLNLTLNPNLTLINYRLKQIDNDGTFAYSKIITVDLSQVTGIEEEIPAEFSLSQNYPNPFNPATTIQFAIPKASHVSLKVYDVLGNEVAELVNEELSAGVYNRTFNAANLSSGIYFYTLRANNFTATKKLMLIK